MVALPRAALGDAGRLALGTGGCRGRRPGPARAAPSGRRRAVDRQDDATVAPNVVDVFVGYLRRTLEAACEPRVIRTVTGVGFVLEDPAAA